MLYPGEWFCFGGLVGTTGVAPTRIEGGNGGGYYGYVWVQSDTQCDAIPFRPQETFYVGQIVSAVSITPLFITPKLAGKTLDEVHPELTNSAVR